MTLRYFDPLSPSKTLKKASVDEYEYVILTDLATRLSSYIASRTSSSPLDSNCPTITSELNDEFGLEEDAELLINLMSSEPILGSAEVMGVLSEKALSPSLSFETNHLLGEEQESLCQNFQAGAPRANHANADKSKRHACSNSHSENTIHVTYPCLSLASLDPSINTIQYGLSTTPRPTSLMSRQVQVTDKPCSVAIKHVADQLAMNAMTSFKLAMEWRAKVWISKLIRCMKFNSSKIIYNQDQTSSMASSDFEVESSDAKLIRALLRSLSSVTVSDVRTTVQILEKQGMTRDNLKSHDYSGDTCDEYNLSHAVNMDFTFAISNRNDISLLNRMSVSLHTPGVIQGSFRRSREYDFPLSLSSVHFSLDTSTLSHEMERQSRRIIRSFTEEYILSCHPALYPCIPSSNVTNCVPQIKEAKIPVREQGNITSIEEYDDISIKSSLDGKSDESLIPTSYELYNFPVVTPHEVNEYLEKTDSSHSIPSTLSVHTVLEQSHPNKKQRLSPNKKYLHPRRVSPNIFKSDSSTDSHKGYSIATSASTDTAGKIGSYESQSHPSIISPTPGHEKNSFECTKAVNPGPLLPSLAEFVCGMEHAGN